VIGNLVVWCVYFVLHCLYTQWHMSVEFVFMYVYIAQCVDDRNIILIGAEMITDRLLMYTMQVHRRL